MNLNAYDWAATEAALDEHGWAPLAAALTSAECDELASLYPREEHFRSRVVMARHGFGRGEYQYFRYPLPALVAELRGESGPPTSVGSRSRAAATQLDSAADASKKNAEPAPVTTGLGRIPEAPRVEAASPSPNASLAESESPHDANGDLDESGEHESVLKRFQEALSAGATAVPSPTVPRVSRREQMLEQQREVGARPFVQKAMELFAVPPGQFRYTPPDGDPN
jgi:hypothetical protein